MLSLTPVSPLFSPTSSSLSFSVPPLCPTCGKQGWGGGGGIQMLMRRSERRGGHGLNRHGKHAQAYEQTYTHHANWCLKAKLGSESSMGKLTVSRERQKNGKRERAIKHIGTLSIEN